MAGSGLVVRRELLQKKKPSWGNTSRGTGPKKKKRGCDIKDKL